MMRYVNHKAVALIAAAWLACAIPAARGVDV